jgi:hypothetical protein
MVNTQSLILVAIYDHPAYFSDPANIYTLPHSILRMRIEKWLYPGPLIGPSLL